VRPPGAGRWLLAGVLALSGCGSGDGLRGTAVVVQDVEGLGEQGLERGWVVAVPAASADAVWAGEDVPSDVELPHVSVPISRAQVEAVSGVVGAIDDGDFALDAPAGSHLLCLVEANRFGERSRGCGYADLPSSGRLEVTTGEAGFRVAVAD
jgi:hypothetical protein